jgi:hypothetical protein
MNTIPSRRDRYLGAFGGLPRFGMVTYVLYVGLSMLATPLRPRQQLAPL